MTIPDHVARFVAMKQRLGYQFTTNAGLLSSFAPIRRSPRRGLPSR